MYISCFSISESVQSYLCWLTHTHMHKNYLKIKIMKNSSTISEFSDQLQRNSQMNKLWSFKVRLKSKMKNQKPLNKKIICPSLSFFFSLIFFNFSFFHFHLFLFVILSFLLFSLLYFSFFFSVFIHLFKFIQKIKILKIEKNFFIRLKKSL